MEIQCRSIPLDLYDWIMPGEIRYCTCGNYLVEDLARTCGICLHKQGLCSQIFEKDGGLVAVRDYVDEAIHTHNMIAVCATMSAKTRRDNGLPAKFWLLPDPPKLKPVSDVCDLFRGCRWKWSDYGISFHRRHQGGQNWLQRQQSRL